MGPPHTTRQARTTITFSFPLGCAAARRVSEPEVTENDTRTPRNSSSAQGSRGLTATTHSDNKYKSKSAGLAQSGPSIPTGRRSPQHCVERARALRSKAGRCGIAVRRHRPQLASTKSLTKRAYGAQLLPPQRSARRLNGRPARSGSQWPVKQEAQRLIR